MGLEEKRMLKQLQEEVFPRYEKELQEITGSKIAYDIDWDSFADNRAVLSVFEQSALAPVNEAFREVCRDDLGKQAVKESIKKVHLRQGGDAYASNFTLTDGTLDLPWDWESWPGSFYAQTIAERIGEML